MQKYHIKKDGSPGICRAISGKCPLGGENVHFNSIIEAEQYADYENKMKFLETQFYNIKDKSPNDVDKERSHVKFDEFRTWRASKSDSLDCKIDKNEISDFVAKEGGMSLSIRNNEYVLIKNGFCSSPYPERCKVIMYKVGQNLDDETDKFVEQNKDLLSKENHILGYWVDTSKRYINKNGDSEYKLYIDVSINNKSATESRDMCKNNEQIAFFDLQDFSEVIVDKNAKGYI